MDVIASSKMYKNHQIAIPKVIRDEFDELENENVILDWGINDNGEIVIKPRRKRTLEDLNGLIKLGYPTDSVELKKELYE